MSGRMIVRIDENDASAFIGGYSRLMAEIYGKPPARRASGILEMLAAARARYMADRSLLDKALHGLAGKAASVPDAVVSAIRSLEVEKWVYLRDTRSHSIFIHPSGQVAYGVLGLTERIRNIIGGSGAVIETGVVRYRGHYVTDGIVSNVVWLGPNYKKDFAGVLAQLRSQGAFHAACASRAAPETDPPECEILADYDKGELKSVASRAERAKIEAAARASKP